MPQLIVRDLDHRIVQRLKARAVRHFVNGICLPLLGSPKFIYKYGNGMSVNFELTA